MLAESDFGGATAPLPLGRWSSSDPVSSNAEGPPASSASYGVGSASSADAPYYNNAGHPGSTYNSYQPPQSQSQPSQSLYGSQGYASQAPQYPAYPSAPSNQSDPLSSFGQLSLNQPPGGSSGGAYSQSAGYNTPTAPPYPGGQAQTHQAALYDQGSTQGSWNQASGQYPQYPQGTGMYQQPGNPTQLNPSYPPPSF